MMTNLITIAVVESLTAERDALRAELDALKADAARYRWLFGARTEAECADEDVGLKPIKPQDIVIGDVSGFYAHKEYVDAAIDSAMKEQQ